MDLWVQLQPIVASILRGWVMWIIKSKAVRYRFELRQLIENKIMPTEFHLTTKPFFLIQDLYNKYFRLTTFCIKFISEDFFVPLHLWPPARSKVT